MDAFAQAFFAASDAMLVRVSFVMAVKLRFKLQINVNIVLSCTARFFLTSRNISFNLAHRLNFILFLI